MAPVVHVLLATYNGERHLPEQWASIESQQDVEVVLHLADDGSSDGTVALLEQLAARRSGAVQTVQWMHAEPRRGATRSFLMLLRHALDSDPNARWFAFCDQDDVWLPEKLSAAIGALAVAKEGIPSLYGGRSLSIDDAGREQGLSPLFVCPPQFRNALVQSIMGGNTMLMNREAATLVASAVSADLIAHDWFSYQIVSGAGGFVHYDPRAFVLYRQHPANLVGSNQGLRARWRRFRRILRGDYGDWNERHVRALQARARELTADSRKVLEAFGRARTAGGPLARLAWLGRSGAFRQPGIQQASLWIACLLRRI